MSTKASYDKGHSSSTNYGQMKLTLANIIEALKTWINFYKKCLFLIFAALIQNYPYILGLMF